MSIPGIGWIVASQLLARIGDWREIDNVRQLGSFLGLVPTENSTGDNVDRGSITGLGDGRLRSKLIQAAWSAIRQDAELREFLSFGLPEKPPWQRPQDRDCGSGAKTQYAGLRGTEKPATVHC